MANQPKIFGVLYCCYLILGLGGLGHAGLTDGLVAYYPFNANANDESGNGNNGIVSGATLVEDRLGNSNSAYNLNGTDNLIDIPNSASLNPSNQISVAAWYKAASFAGSGNDPIVDKGYFNHSYPFYQYHLGVTGDQYWHNQRSFCFNIATQDGVSYGASTGQGFWQLDKWYFIVGIYDGSNVSLYVDGVLINSSQASGALQDFGTNVRIGAYNNISGSSYQLSGTVDEVRIYNRALSNAEVTALYLHGAKTIQNGVYSYTDQCQTNLSWCAHPTFEFFGMISSSDVPFNLINNSYIVDGLTRNVSKGNVTITANLYNRGYADAMLDIYDNQFNWKGFIVVGGNRPETSIVDDVWDKWTTIYDSYYDEYSNFDPRDAGSSEQTTVNKLALPKRGYAVLSKNSTSAIANTVLNNSLSILGELAWIKNQKGNVKLKLIKIFSEEVAKSSLDELVFQLKNAISENDQIEASVITSKMTKELSLISFKVFVTDGDKLIKVLGDKKAKRFAKKSFKYFSASGALIEAAETIATGLSITGQWIDIAKANNDKAVYFK
jgi:hypothetical protein